MAENITWEDRTDAKTPTGATTEMPAANYNALKDHANEPVQKLTTFTDTDIRVDGSKSYSTIKAITTSTHTITINATLSNHKEGNYLTARYSFSKDCTITLENTDTTGDKTGTITPIPSGTYDFYFIAGAFGVWVGVKNNSGAAATTYLFKDTFDGVVINTTTKWDLTNTDPTFVVFSQNEELEIESVQGDAASSLDNFIATQDTFDLSSEKVFTFDFKNDNQDGPTFVTGIQYDVNSRIVFYTGGAADSVNYLANDESTPIGFSSSSVTLDLTAYKTLKIRVTAAVTILSYWNGASWVQIDSASHGWTKSMKVMHFQASTTSQAEVANIDNVYVTDFDFTTRYPS